MSSSMISAVMFASVLAGAVVGLWNPWIAVRFAAVGVAIAAAAAGVVVLKGRRSLWPVVLSLGVVVLAFLAFHLYSAVPPVPMRSVQLAAALAWGAILLAGALRILRVTDDSRALLLSFSIAITLVIADAIVPPPPVLQYTRWQANSQPDPDVGHRYAPNTTAKNFYPDNPRGYFEKSNPLDETWRLEVHGETEAHLEREKASMGDIVRITMPKLVNPQPWHVKLQQAPLKINTGTRYSVSFNARAEAPRPISCVVGQNHEPWERLGTYHEYQIGPEWSRVECPFLATGSDANARLYFDLAKSNVTVELQNVVVRDETTGRLVQPETASEEYFISYKFNSLGFRGPDRAIPAPPGTFRIVALGDSYTLGVGVREEDTFEAQLEKRLNAAGAAKGEKTVYEVINAGVSGYETQQERLSYLKYSSKYEPQVVLVMMVFNDDLSFTEEQELGLGAAPPEGISRLAARVAKIGQPERQYDYKESVRELLELNVATQKRGQKLVVVIFRQSGTFEPWAKLVADVTEGLDGTGIPLLDLGNVLVGGEYSERELKVHDTDGHPNEVAHRVAAEEIERFLRTERLLP